MIESEQSTLGNRSRAPELTKVDDLPILAMWSERDRIHVTSDDAESEHSFVKREGTIEIRNLKADSAQPCRLG
jgi:hypothetical protein